MPQLHVFLVVNMMGFVQHQIPVTAILDGPEIVVAFVSLTSLSSDTYSIMTLFNSYRIVLIKFIMSLFERTMICV